MARRPPNQSSGSNVVNRLQELERRFKQRMDLPSAPEEEILSNIGGLHQKIESTLASPNSLATAAQDVYSMQQEIEKLYGQLGPLETRRTQAATKSYIGGATTALRGSNLASEVNAVAGGSAAIAAASGMVNIPTYRLEQMRGQAMNTMGQMSGSILQGISNDPNSGINQGALSGLGGQVSAAASAQAALVMQRRMGLDIESRMTNSRESLGRIGSYLESKDLTARVRSGAVGNRSDIESSMKTDLNKIERLQGMQEKFGADPAKFERLQSVIDKLTDSASKAASTLKEMDRQGVSGGGGFTGFMSSPRVRGGLELIQAGSDLGRQVADQWTYMNPMRERQNQVSYANIANRQFDDSRAALSGDMSALRRLGGAYGAASDANKMGKAGSRVSTLFEGVGGMAGVGLSLGAGVAAAALAGTGVGIPVALGIMGAAAIVNKSAANWNQQAGERGSALAEAELRRQDALAHISDASVQQYRDLAAGMGQSTVGAGAARSGLFGQMTSKEMIGRYASVGIDSQQAVQLASMGVQALGGEFNPNQIQRAGQLRQGGYMNEQQYFQNVSQLSAVGGNADKNLEEILKNAVANGMDNAKSIAQMVQATTQLASRTAAAGIDTATGAGTVVGRMMDSLSDQGVPMNMRGAAAQAAGNFVQGATTDTGLNLYTVGRWSNVASKFRGASRAQMQFLAGMSAEDVATLGGANGADYAKKTGLDNLLLDANGKVDQDKLKALQQGQREQVINRVMGPGLSEKARQGLLKANSYEDFQAMVQRGDIDQQSARDILATGAFKNLNVGAVFGAVEGGRGRAGTVQTTTGGGAGEMDTQNRQRAEADAKLIDQGRQVIDALGGLKGLTDALGQVAKNFDPKEMSKSTKEAADKFTVPVRQFGDAVGAFRDAVSNMSSTKR